MTLALPAPAASRLVRIAGMLGSAYEGERANAAAAATRLLQEHGLTWHDVLAPCPTPQSRQPIDHRAQVRAAMTRAHKLTDWERGFLASVAKLATLSPRQRETLGKILRKAAA